VGEFKSHAFSRAESQEAVTLAVLKDPLRFFASLPAYQEILFTELKANLLEAHFCNLTSYF